MSGVSKLTADRHQRILLDLVGKPGNDVCADCKARAPRWASHNLGIFICMNCASIHRKIGTHITKVKSITMDAWSREQIEIMKSIGNVASNAKYNPNERRNPPPANREESERDSELEKFIRWKYEFKRFMEKPSSNPSSSSVKTPVTRAQSTPAMRVARPPSPAPQVPTYVAPQTPSSNPYISRPSLGSATGAASSPARPSAAPPPTVSTPSIVQPPPQPQPRPIPAGPVWDDIMSLSAPSASHMPQFHQGPLATSGNPYASLSPTNPFPTPSLDRSPSRSATVPIAASSTSPFQLQNLQPTTGNPFVMPQSTEFSNHMTGAMFQQQNTQSQSPFRQSPFGHSGPTPFGQPAQSPYAQSTQTPFSQSYTPPSSFPQQVLQQQFTPSSMPPLPMQQQQQYQQGYQQPVQGGNPFGSWPQQPAFGGQQPAGFSGQPGYSGQQQYGQWGNM